MKYAKVTRLVSLIADHSLYKIETFKENNMRKAGRISTMKQRSIGRTSPPLYQHMWKGYYGGLKKFGFASINRLNGINVLLNSLGSVGRLKSNQWMNPPNAPNRQGTLQENIDFWKGQKVHIPFRNSLKKILKRQTNLEKYYESFKNDPPDKKYEPERIG